MAAVLLLGTKRPARTAVVTPKKEKRTVAMKAFENELGVQAPVGFWDPVGFTKDGDAEAFRRRRSTEIKHGRISMLATIGYIQPELTGKFPGYLSPSKGLAFEDIPNGLGALSKVPLAGWFQIVLYCLYCEASGLGFGYITDGEQAPVGYWDPAGFGADGDAALFTKRRVTGIK